MTDYLEELIKLCPPPEQPQFTGSADVWTHLEEQANIVFPEDYKKLINTYGPGTFGNFLTIGSPFRWPDPFAFKNAWRHMPDIITAGQKEHPADYPPFDLWPNGWTVILGTTDNTYTVAWYENECDYIVTMDCDMSPIYGLHLMTLTEFIVKWMNGTIIPYGFLDRENYYGPRDTFNPL